MVVVVVHHVVVGGGNGGGSIPSHAGPTIMAMVTVVVIISVLAEW